MIRPSPPSSTEVRTRVVVDALPEAGLRYGAGWAIVAVDVIRASTTAVTALAMGRRCLPVPDVTSAVRRAASEPGALLVGEVRGVLPDGFDMNNSPAEMATRIDVHRPAILVSSSGTPLICNADRSGHAYVACLRNARATAEHLADRYRRVAVVGAGSRGEFREEDQFCCALIAGILARRGFAVRDRGTVEVLRRWRDAPVDAWLYGASVRYLRSTGQEADLEYILSHRDDLEIVVRTRHGELRAEDPGEDARSGSGARRAGPAITGGAD